MRDIIIIGAGVTGCAISYYLSEYETDILVLEAHSDVCEGTSKANSGIIHAGFDAKPGSMKAKLNVRGSELTRQLSKELKFGYIPCGSLVLCFDRNKLEELEELRERGEKNGVKELRILSHDEILDMEPQVNENVVAALYAPTGAVADPFDMTTRFADSASLRGVEFRLNKKVTNIERIDDHYSLYVKDEVFEAKMIINAAGLYADTIHNLVSKKKIKITARRGEYMLLDNSHEGFVTHTIFQLPGDYGKGVLVTPTTHGNILVGPNACALENKEDTDTTSEGLSYVRESASKAVKDIPFYDVITGFAGLRATLTSEEDHDFLIGEPFDAPGFIDAAGIESPGLSSAPAIGEMVTKIAADRLHLKKKEGILPIYRDDKNPHPEDNNILCRCRNVSEGDVIRAIKRPVGATTTDGVKRRTFAGMGRCQSGFCNPKVVEILARELGIRKECVTKNDEGSCHLEGDLNDRI